MGVGGHSGARRRFGGLGGVETRTGGKLPWQEVASGGGGAASGGGRGRPQVRTRVERDEGEERKRNRWRRLMREEADAACGVERMRETEMRRRAGDE